MVSHSGLVRHQKDPCRCEETSQQQECGVIQVGHCPGHKKAPEQELVLGQAHSSNEGIITANVVSKQGDYTQQQDWGEDGAKKATEEELDITATTMAAGGGQKIVVLPNILFALLGYGAMYNQHTACLTNQVHFSTLTNVMLPSQSSTDAITMPHHVKWVCVRDPGPNEGGARHYPYQREEGRHHHLGPDQQNGHYYCHCVDAETPPQGPYMVGPPEPYSEASQKQMYFASEQVHTYIVSRQLQYKTKKLCKVPGQDFVRFYKPQTFKTFTHTVKVVSLTYFEELLVRNRAMCLILCYRHILFIVVCCKTATYLG